MRKYQEIMCNSTLFAVEKVINSANFFDNLKKSIDFDKIFHYCRGENGSMGYCRKTYTIIATLFFQKSSGQSEFYIVL